MSNPVPPPLANTETFNRLLPVILKLVEARKSTWRVTTMEWNDVQQILLVHVWEKIHTFDPGKGPFDRWCNRVISNRRTNILRDNLFRWQRPCIRDGGCTYDLGDGGCAYTASRRQCEECPLYAKWKDKKEGEYNLRSTMALENHTREVSNIQSDFLDIDYAKRVIDERMLKRLTPWERRIYRLVYIKHLTPLQASEKLKRIAIKRKTPLDPQDAVDYQSVLKVVKTMKEMMIRIIKSEDLANVSGHSHAPSQTNPWPLQSN